MADERAPNGKDFDPMGGFREARDNYLDAWAKTMVEAVNSDAYAKASGAVLDTYLSASSPFRETLEKAMLHALQQLSMPSRADFISLAERMTNIEMKLDDVDAKLDEITRPAAKPAGPKTRTAARGKRKGAK
ncbi:MAG TPA: hypothetical protein VND65_23145 [Candidatus Binatia bacterium]|nr:hypothetical protein [Candidatus Binatia bacterium]